MNKKKPKFESLLQTESLDGYPDGDAIQVIGTIQDVSYENNYLEGMNHALKLAKSIKKREFSKRHSAYLNYTIANIWFDRYKLKNPKKESWKWESEDYVQIIIYYRKALRDILDSGIHNPLDKLYYSQITTNLSNNLSHLGRIVEAIEGWNRCLSLNSSFGMARGNLGHGLMQYSRIIYDPGHQAYLLREAHKHLKQGLTQDITQEAKEGFTGCIDQIESLLSHEFINEDVDLNKWDLGASKDEKDYRKWCLKNVLFLNPLNDFGNNTIAATDILHLPDIITKIDEKPFHHGLFNVIKQEYVSARFLLFESIQLAQKGEQHFSDKNNHLVDTLDYSFHSLGIEKEKLAFRMAYSIFDKVAFYMNAYFKLGKAKDRVNFKNVWYVKNNGECRVRTEFNKYENWPLRGLFWLSKDLFARNDEFKKCLEPDAKELDSIRNHLEHKYLKVHMFGSGGSSPISSDSFAYSISRDDLHEKALRILKLSRSAIMYLVFAIHIEERMKRRNIDETKIGTIHTVELFDGHRH